MTLDILHGHSASGTEESLSHNPICPELVKGLKDHGLSNDFIFLHPETRYLCGDAVGNRPLTPI